MPGKINLFQLGYGGVNNTKDPLHLADNELTQAQNAEIVEDVNVGGAGALAKRGGLQALNSSPLSGSVTGIFSFPILTSFTRTLYAGLGTHSSSTFKTTTNGTSWTNTSTPNAPVSPAKYGNENDVRTARRCAVAWNNFIYYAGNTYTQNTDNPDIQVFDGTTGQLVTRIAIGGEGNTSPAYVVTDMLAANSVIYIAVHDPGGSGTSPAGRVLQYDPVSDTLSQVMNAFGPTGSGNQTGGYPAALAYYQGQLWVGQNNNATTDGIGQLVRGYPSVSTTWTVEKSNFVSSITSISSFLGDLYVATMSSASNGAQIYKRASGTGTWTSQVTSASGAGDNGHYGNLLNDSTNGACYATEYFASTDVLKILRTTDGSTWSVDRDVEANDSPQSPPNFPGAALIYSGDIFYVFKATSGTNADGFIMRRHSGTWSKVDTDNYGGPLVQLTVRS